LIYLLVLTYLTYLTTIFVHFARFHLTPLLLTDYPRITLFEYLFGPKDIQRPPVR
jgi:hypothetical protein